MVYYSLSGKKGKRLKIREAISPMLNGDGKGNTMNEKIPLCLLLLTLLQAHESARLLAEREPSSRARERKTLTAAAEKAGCAQRKLG